MPTVKRFFAILIITLAGWAVLAQDTASVARAVWSFPNQTEPRGVVSHSGRYLPYVDWDDNSLILHNLVTGTDLLVARGNGSTLGASHEQVIRASVSRDDGRIAYGWQKDGIVRMRIANLNESGTPQFQELSVGEAVIATVPFDWSPDGNSIAVQVERKDEKQIGLLPVSGGSLRILQSIGSDEMTSGVFSPDGKYLAFSTRGAGSRLRQDAFLVSLERPKVVPIANTQDDEGVIGWTPDSRRLLIARSPETNGSADILAVRINDGAIGIHELLKQDCGDLTDSSLTDSGGIFFMPSVAGTRGDIGRASFDFSKDVWTSPIMPEFPQPRDRRQHPAWSPDGTRLAYVSSPVSWQSPPFNVRVRTLSDGSERQLPTKFTLFNSLTWTPDGASLLVRGRDETGQIGLFQVGASSGSTSLILPMREVGTLLWAADLSRDMKTLFYGTEKGLFARQLDSRVDRQLIQAFVDGFRLSPDKRQIVTVTTDQAAGTKTVVVMSADGGEKREVYQSKTRAESGKPNDGSLVESLILLMWATDSRSLYVRKRFEQSSADDEVWRVYLNGTPPIKMSWSISQKASEFRVHPDDMQIAFQVAQPKPVRQAFLIQDVFSLSH